MPRQSKRILRKRLYMLETEGIISRVFLDTIHEDIYNIPKRDLGLIALIQPLSLSAGQMLCHEKNSHVTPEDYQLIYKVSCDLLKNFIMQAPVSVALLDTDLNCVALSQPWLENSFLTHDKEIKNSQEVVVDDT